jgi:aryl-alcohol dehydrogenase-like predicted oxidoreductase
MNQPQHGAVEHSREAAMHERTLGKDGLRVSAIGLGCMGMSDFYGSPATRDDARSLATIHSALDAGVTLFDTADFYGSGHNELLLGRALAGRREGVVVSVKFGVLRTPGGGFGGLDGRPASVKNFAAYSLRRLGLDVIDLYQPARVDPAVPLEDTIGAIADLVREGKVRCLAVSEIGAAQLRRAHAVHPVTALQIEYSLASRGIEAEILPAARELGVGIVAYSPLCRGLLSGALEGCFAPTDFRAHAPRFQGEKLAGNLAKAGELRAIAQSLGVTPSQLAIAWVLDRGKDIAALAGTTRPDRLRENLGALALRLTDAERAALDRAFGPAAIAGERYPAAQMGLVAR